MTEGVAMEWGCEECEFSCATDEEAFAHCDAAKHSLAMRPVRPEGEVPQPRKLPDAGKPELER